MRPARRTDLHARLRSGLRDAVPDQRARTALGLDGRSRPACTRTPASLSVPRPGQRARTASDFRDRIRPAYRMRRPGMCGAARRPALASAVGLRESVPDQRPYGAWPGRALASDSYESASQVVGSAPRAACPHGIWPSRPLSTWPAGCGALAWAAQHAACASDCGLVHAAQRAELRRTYAAWFAWRCAGPARPPAPGLCGAVPGATRPRAPWGMRCCAWSCMPVCGLAARAGVPVRRPAWAVTYARLVRQAARTCVTASVLAPAARRAGMHALRGTREPAGVDGAAFASLGGVSSLAAGRGGLALYGMRDARLGARGAAWLVCGALGLRCA
ncbi:hypothetical protein FHU30_002283 [Actinomadura rupiterrae]|nr:hypothetical protein [Actinomadura rupiterrae]